MKKFKNLIFAALAIVTLSMSSCLHIVEELTFRKNGKGSYKMSLDMGEMKSMMEMFKNMAPDSAQTETPESPMGGADMSGGMSQMGKEISGVAASLKGLNGIANVVEINDTTNLLFGYSFDFDNVKALNEALKIINKEKYQSKSEEFFKFSGKSFERTSAGDMGEEMKKALSQGGEGEDGGGDMEMMKNFFSDMSYKQIYHFPDQEIKKNNNELGQISEDKHSLTVTLKPFDEDMQKKKMTIATALKLK